MGDLPCELGPAPGGMRFDVDKVLLEKGGFNNWSAKITICNRNNRNTNLNSDFTECFNFINIKKFLLHCPQWKGNKLN